MRRGRRRHGSGVKSFLTWTVIVFFLVGMAGFACIIGALWYLGFLW